MAESRVWLSQSSQFDKNVLIFSAEQWRDFFQMADPSRLRQHSLRGRSRLDLHIFNAQPKGREYVEWPARRRRYGSNGESIQKQARGPP